MSLYRRYRDKRDMKAALMLLWRIDIHMRRDKWPQYRRKRFWSEFIKSPASRGIVFQQVLASMRTPPKPGKGKKKLRRKNESEHTV